MNQTNILLVMIQIQQILCVIILVSASTKIRFLKAGKEKKERNVLFNDALNTFYLRLYGVRRMVKDHSDSEKGNPLPPHRLLLSISSKGSFYMHHPTDRITHTTAFVTPVVEHWLEREIAQWVHTMEDRSDDPSHHERTLLPRSYISLLGKDKKTKDSVFVLNVRYLHSCLDLNCT